MCVKDGLAAVADIYQCYARDNLNNIKYLYKSCDNNVWLTIDLVSLQMDRVIKFLTF